MTAAAGFTVKVMGPVNVVVKWILAALLAAMCLLIGWQIFARFIMGDALEFSEEASRFIMVWLVLLGAGYAVKDHRLIRVDALELFLKNRSRSVVMVSAWLVSIVFYILLIWFGTSMALGVTYQIAPSTEISMTWAIAALPVGGLLMLFNTLYAISRFSLGLGLSGDPQEDETSDDSEANDGADSAGPRKDGDAQ